jgi:tetratricopeptide (TPR) repeat protein
MLAASVVLFVGVVAYRLWLDAPPHNGAPRSEAPLSVAPSINADLSDPQVVRNTLGAADMQGAIQALQAQIKQNPAATQLYSQLGWAYVQRARENADPANYVQAALAFDEALKREPQNVDALVGHGSLALSLHQFEKAIAWAEKAQAINPFRAQIYGVIGDSLIELGRYEDAIKAVQKMVDTRPDLSSYSRVSYVRELHGDVDGAIEAMRRAVQAGNPLHEGTLWAAYQLGNLYFSKGDLKNAEELYRAALGQQGDYVYARAGLAKVWAARGDTDKAIAEYQKITTLLPLPEFVIALGDLYEASGQADQAKTQFDLVRAIQKLNAAASMDVDMELALFEADQLTLRQQASIGEGSVARARAVYARRPSIYAADALAWVLYKHGQFDEAAQYSKAALKLGTKDALLHFHAGMIALAQNDFANAKQFLNAAMQINPYFSVRYVPVARAALAQLQ